jgi:hypothetical protein
MFGWLASKNKYERFPDSFASKRERIVQSITDTAVREIGKNRITLIVTHFPATYADLSDSFDRHALSYQVLDTDRPLEQFKLYSAKPQISPILSWSGSLLRAQSSVGPANSKLNRLERPLSIIVAERHPRWLVDEDIAQICREMSSDVKIGWYVSFEDPVVKKCLGENGIQLMKMMGMKSNEVITSELLSGRIGRVLRSKSMQCDPSIELTSAEQWVDLVSQKTNGKRA